MAEEREAEKGREIVVDATWGSETIDLDAWLRRYVRAALEVAGFDLSQQEAA